MFIFSILFEINYWPTALCDAARNRLRVYFLISTQSSKHKWGVNDSDVAPEAPNSDKPEGQSVK